MAIQAASTMLGTIAASCTTVAFVPQIRRIVKTGGRDVSYQMLMLYLAGVALWCGYGLVVGASGERESCFLRLTTLGNQGVVAQKTGKTSAGCS